VFEDLADEVWAGGPPRSFRGGLAISRSGFKPALDELTFRSGMESQIDACIRELELIENPRPKERTWATRPASHRGTAGILACFFSFPKRMKKSRQ